MIEVICYTFSENFLLNLCYVLDWKLTNILRTRNIRFLSQKRVASIVFHPRLTENVFGYMQYNSAHHSQDFLPDIGISNNYQMKPYTCVINSISRYRANAEQNKAEPQSEPQYRTYFLNKQERRRSSCLALTVVNEHFYS